MDEIIKVEVSKNLLRDICAFMTDIQIINDDTKYNIDEMISQMKKTKLWIDY